MKRNWILKLLVACNGAMTVGLAYQAYHIATYSFGFPDSAAMRWFERFEELFPNLSILPRLVVELTGNGLLTGSEQGNRWGLVLHAMVAAWATGALTYGLTRGAEWARKTFLVTGLVQLFLALLKLGPMGLHLVAGGIRGMSGYLTGLMSLRIPPMYTILGAFIAAGVARFMWRWGAAPLSESSGAGNAPGQQVPALEFSAWSAAIGQTLTRWTRTMRGALLFQFLAILVLKFSSAAAWKSWSLGVFLSLVVWLAMLWLMSFLLSLEDPRLGVGLGVGYAGTLLLPMLGLLRAPLFLLLLGFQTWFQLGLAALGIVSVLVLFVCGIRASVLLGKAPLGRAGEWGLGVLLPFVAATVFFQVLQESTYAKAPARSREMTLEQSHEYERGHAAQEMVRLIAKCAFQYASAHPQEGFPEALQQLGTAGSDCVSLSSSKPLVEDHEFEYQASRRIDGGPRDKFTARSHEVQHPAGTFSLPDLQVNETGIFITLEGSRPFSFSSELALLNNITGCLRQDFAANGSVGYPSNLRGLLSIKGQYGIPCVPPFEANELSVTGLWNNRFRYRFYDFTYSPTDGKDGHYQGFQLEARPTEYGKMGLRSYLADQSGIAHATPLNRAATIGDPDTACESKQQDCSARVTSSTGNS